MLAADAIHGLVLKNGIGKGGRTVEYLSEPLEKKKKI